MVKTRYSTTVEGVKFPCSILIFAFSFLIFALVGCNTTSDERIAILKTGIDKATALSAEADKYIALLDSQLQQADQILATAQIDADTTAKIREVIAKITAEKARVEAQKNQVDQSIAEWSKQIEAITASGSANIGTELQIIGTGMTTAAPAVPGPAGGYLALAGALLAAIGAGVGKIYQARKDSDSLQALPEIIEGVDDLLSQVIPPGDLEKAKQLLMLRQSSETQQLVGDLKKN